VAVTASAFVAQCASDDDEIRRRASRHDLSGEVTPIQRFAAYAAVSNLPLLARFAQQILRRIHSLPEPIAEPLTVA
jgi:hypothetical protein